MDLQGTPFTKQSPVSTHENGDGKDQPGSTNPNHYHDIESLRLTLNKSRGRKTSKDKRHSSIWTETLENEKENTPAERKSSNRQSSNSLPPKSSKSKTDKLVTIPENIQKSSKIFLENNHPLLTKELKNWTLPRVELWCRDPNCIYNKCLWGNHYTNQHSPAVVQEVEEVDTEGYHTDTNTRSSLSNSTNSNQSSPPTSQQLSPSTSMSPNHHHINVGVPEEMEVNPMGRFTLNGQYNTIPKKPTMQKFCSSHKISLVVSTFSLLVTIGLLITLLLMKKRGMMDTMMDH